MIEVPKWRRGDLADRVHDHMDAESIYERQVGSVLQVVERVVFRDRPTQDMRPFYRLTEVRNNRAKVVRTNALRACQTQAEVRHQADKRARAILRKIAAMQEP